MNEQKIADLIYDYIDYMYCDNCRYNYEQDGDDACEDCHRKNNGWGISMSAARSLSKEIAKLGSDEN